MSKISLIIQREYSSRVKKKSFLLTTLLVPILFPTIIGLIIYFSQSERENATADTIYVLDESGKFDYSSESNRTEYQEIGGPLESAKEALLESDAYALLYIPSYDPDNPEGFQFLTQASAKDPVVSAVERKIENMIRDQRMNNYQIEQETLDKLNVNISLSPLNISEGNERRSDARINIAIGYLTGFLIYIFMFAYGGQVMQGVIEEKSNKIVEIIISTVKPFQLMMGKILGIALVGLTQVAIWVVLMWVVWTGVMMVIGPEAVPAAEAMQTAQASAGSSEVLELIESIPFTRIILTFIFYFLGGYLLYGALFAAVGSAVDSPSEAQQFMFPIMLPLVIGFVGMSSILDNPDSQLGFWLSMIPFTSPIAMMGRIGYDVPAWELILSMVLLVLGFFGTTWLAGRIYRIGILMHGSKVNYKVLAKWVRMK